MNELQKQKLEMWQKKLKESELALADALRRKSEQAQTGYLSENAYKIAAEEIEMVHARINEITKIIQKIKSN